MTKALFAAMLCVAPISSVLVHPSLQGVTPGVLIATVLLAWMSVSFFVRGRVPIAALTLAQLLSVFLVHVAISQLLLLVLGFPSTSDLILNRPSAGFSEFRITLASQGLYLFLSFSFFALTAQLYEKGYERYLLLGASAFAVYGVLEVLLFFVIGENSDFLSNRTFGEDGDKSGSLFQTVTVGSLSMLRLKSLAGEPSMYVFTIFPLYVLAVGMRRRLTSMLLLISLLMTGSSTALFVFFVYGLTRAIMMRSFKPLMYLGGVSIFLGAALFPLVEAIVRETIAKLALESFSGQDRLGSFLLHLVFWLDAPIHIQLFGIGFGAVRSPDFFTTLLVNTGAIGVAAFSAFYLLPAALLGRNSEQVAIRCALISTYFMFLTSVAEYSYAVPWIVLGIAYKELAKGQSSKASAHSNLQSARLAQESFV